MTQNKKGRKGCDQRADEVSGSVVQKRDKVARTEDFGAGQVSHLLIGASLEQTSHIVLVSELVSARIWLMHEQMKPDTVSEERLARQACLG